MENRPVIKIAGKRYTAKHLTMGAYRQLVLLMQDVQALTEDEFKDDACLVIQETFGLTPEQADQIEVADVLPLFRAITQWATGIFTSKVEQLPNVQGPEETPGQN